MPSPAKTVWLDCDPGHDDAIAMLFALSAPAVNDRDGTSSSAEAPAALHLLGCSVVAGNAPVTATFANTARLLEFLGAPLAKGPQDYDGGVHLLMGSEVPLLKQPRSDPAIHGEDGLGGVTGLPPLNSEQVKRRMWASYGASASKTQPDGTGMPRPTPSALLLFLSAMLGHRISKGLPKISLIATGPLTNVALLIRSFPDLVDQGIQEIVLMGGAPPGERGNRGPLAEFNILVDPEAAAIVFDYNIPVVMAGLNVTHQAIFTPQLREKLLHPTHCPSENKPFRSTIASILDFFAQTYASEFGFTQGPPVHDVLAVVYCIDPTIFNTYDSEGFTQAKGSRTVAPKRYKVDIEVNEHSLAMGATVVDFYAKTVPRPEETWWGRGGRNVIVLEHLDVDRLWQLFFQCVERAEIHANTK